MLNHITLSIVIPTYNRAEFLRTLLHSIAQDMLPWPHDLELIISDNASTDTTAEVVAHFCEAGVPIHYRINETNIGGDANISGCFNLANGKYLWVIGDDEVMYRGTVTEVLKLCRSEDFGLLHLTSAVFGIGDQAKVISSQYPTQVAPRILTGYEMFRRANVFLTFISANVVNRHAVLATQKRFDPGAERGSHLSQMKWIFTAVFATKRHLLIDSPAFGALGGNTSGYKLIEVFGINLGQLTHKYCSQSIPRARAIMARAAMSRVLAGELWSAHKVAKHGAPEKKMNQFNSEDLLATSRIAFGRDWFYLLLFRPLFSKRTLVVDSAWFLIRVFNRINRSVNYRLL